MSEWARMTVQALQDSGLLLVEDGNHGEYRPRREEFSPVGTAFIRAADMAEGQVLFDTAARINGAALQRIRKGIGRPQDVLLSHKGTVGKVAWTGESSLPFVCSPQTTFYRSLDHEVIDPRFLYFYLLSPNYQRQLSSRKGETDMADYVSLTEQRRLIIEVPPMREQRAIVEVLGVLDDKIDGDRHSMTLARDLADALFTKWRASIDPPQVVTFAQVADIQGGSTPRTNVPDYWGGDHAWAVPRDVTALDAPYLFDTERHITDAGLASIGGRLHRAGSIFMTSRATIGAFAIPQRQCAANQGFIVVIPRDTVFRWFLFHEMRSRVGEMLDLANGSTFLEISRGNFKNMMTVLPSRGDLQLLDRLLNPMHEWCASVTQESARLAEIRDYLLPRLLSGELRVRDAEALMGEAV